MSIGKPILAQGTQLQYGDGATPEVFVTIHRVKGDIPLPAYKYDIIDVTDHSSTGGQKEKITGLGDPGDIVFTINYLPRDVTHQHLLTLATTRALTNFKYIMVDGDASMWTFSGIVSQFAAKGGINTPYEATVTVTVSGAPVPPAALP